MAYDRCFHGVYPDENEFPEVPPCRAWLRLSFPERESQAHETLTAGQPELLLPQALALAKAKGAESFELQSLEEADFSTKGVLECRATSEGDEARVNLEQLWGVQEYFRDKPIGERFFYPTSSRRKNGGAAVNGYWHSRYFTFGPDAGNAISLANMRYVWRQLVVSGILLAFKTLRQVLLLTPEGEQPVIILADDFLGTHALFFREEIMKVEHPDLWAQVSNIESIQVLDCELLLETEKELAHKTQDLAVHLIGGDKFLRELRNMGKREE